MEKVGIEPTTCRASIDRYYLLSYFSEEQATGLEPAHQGWKPCMQPVTSRLLEPDSHRIEQTSTP
jgi:hypothetical protein